jgi:hypothetical protein
MSSAARYYYFTSSLGVVIGPVAAEDVVMMGLPLFFSTSSFLFFSIAPATTLHSCPNIATKVKEEEEEQSISRTVQKIKK